jgi:hypothetical protein
VSDFEDEEQFANGVRRRSRLVTATIVSIGLAVLLSGLGAITASKPTVVLAGVGWLSTSVTVYLLQGDGYVAPSATINLLGYTAEDRQAAAPVVFLLWAVGAFAVAYAMK